MIFGVTLQVFRKLRDPLSEECDLHVRAPGIFFVELELLNIHCVTACCHKRSRTVDEVRRIASSHVDVSNCGKRVQAAARSWPEPFNRLAMASFG
jgi:hypothetical protein